MNRVLFLIDGFNVYHAPQKQKKYHRYKWLDYLALSKCFVTRKDTITDVILFTAYHPSDRGKKQLHMALVRALKSKKIKIVFGKFKLRDRFCPLCKRHFRIPEEKHTDVNIAVHLFQAAINDSCDTIMLVSGDSDLVPAVRAVKVSFPNKRIGLIVPIGRSSKELQGYCDFRMKMKEKHLESSQFPGTVVLDTATQTTVTRPTSWA